MASFYRPPSTSSPLFGFLAAPMQQQQQQLETLAAMLLQKSAALSQQQQQQHTQQQQPQAFVIHLENVLVPTQWLRDRLGLTASPQGLDVAAQQYQRTPELQVALSAIEHAALELLRLAATLGPVFVVSDHTLTYVEVLCSVLFPTLAAFFRDPTTNVQVLGAPAANLSLAGRAGAKRGAIECICRERLYAGPLATELLAHPVTGRFALVSLHAREIDTMAVTRALEDVAPHAVLKTVQVRAAGGFTSPLELEVFHAQLESLGRLLLDATKHDGPIAVAL